MGLRPGTDNYGRRYPKLYLFFGDGGGGGEVEIGEEEEGWMDWIIWPFAIFWRGHFNFISSPPPGGRLHVDLWHWRNIFVTETNYLRHRTSKLLLLKNFVNFYDSDALKSFSLLTKKNVYETISEEEDEEQQQCGYSRLPPPRPAPSKKQENHRPQRDLNLQSLTH